MFASDPPTAQEKMEMLAARLQGIEVVAVARHLMTPDEWVAHYCVAGERP